jgi:RNA polymerase sigma factor (sigma-70 family)
MVAEEELWEKMIQGLRQGDPQVVQDFCAQYGAALQRLAKKHLPRALNPRVDPEDVVQSACRTFLRRVKEGEFQFDDNSKLWRLLCAITLTKIRETARFHLRQSRSLAREAHLPPNVGDSSSANFCPVDPGPTPGEAVEFDDQFQNLLASLDAEERQAVELKLQDYTYDEIAQQMHSSERTVRRILKRVQTRLSRTFEISDS